MGTDEYNKKKADYMKQYRAKQKQIKENLINTNATIIQSAIRNKLARNAVLSAKQNKANEVVSKINQQRNADDKQSLINKLNAVVMTNDILNNLFGKPIITGKVGRPKRERRPVGRPSGSKNKNKQN